MPVRQATRDELRRVASETFGWEYLRDEQLEAMEQVMAGHDVLAALPTGAGKSAIYQVPALLLDDPTLVVSPLIALQHDQWGNIEETPVPEAVTVNSTQRRGERHHAWTLVRRGAAEYVFLSPEQLAKDEVIAGFDRPNLHLAVRRFTDDADKRHCVISAAYTLVSDPTTRCGLVYAASRKDTEFYATGLMQCGVRVTAYHAGMKAPDRERVHQEFLAGDLDVVVATSAFGMGIDKPDVRFVLHASVSESLDSYYQQIGRPGRDGQPAEITLFYRSEDVNLQKFLTTSSVPRDVLDEVVHAFKEHGEPVRSTQLKDELKVSAVKRKWAVNLLEQAGAVGTTSDGRIEYLDPQLRADQAVEQAVGAAETHQRLIRSRIQMMRGYAETTGCRRQYLLGYFGEQLPHPCANCDTCAAGTAEKSTDRIVRRGRLQDAVPAGGP